MAERDGGVLSLLRLTESGTHYPSEGTTAQIAFLEGLPPPPQSCLLSLQTTNKGVYG